MAFMSLMIAGAVLAVTLIGLLILIAGIILIIVWKVKKRRGRPVKKSHKTLAVVFTVWGAVQLGVPVLLFAGYNIYEDASRAAKIAEADEKINVEYDWDRDAGITMGGVDYVPADYLTGKDGGEKKAALIYPDGDADYIYTVENEKNYDMVRLYSKVFVPKEQADEIRDYYTREAPLYVTISFYDEYDEYREYKVDFDRSMLERLNALYDFGMSSVVEYRTDDVKQTFYITGETSDGLFGLWGTVEVTDKGPVLAHICGGGRSEGHILPDDMAEYIFGFTNELLPETDRQAA
ncbi:MAG: hypothetical protein IJG50_07085 [Clostridia bacterium]|nr:hypothetical protein [Clostridia bacterium]